MKRYVRASSNGYWDIFEKITKYFTKYAVAMGAQYASYNDYVVEPDWAGGGIRIELQWTGSAPTEDDVKRIITSYFGSGITCSDSWGKWDHQITVHVADYRCR